MTPAHAALLAVRHRKTLTRLTVAGVLVAVLAVVGALVAVVGLLGAAGASTVTVAPTEDATCAVTVAGGSDALAAALVAAGKIRDSDRAESAANAATIMGRGQAAGVTPQAWVVALATAAQESGVLNLTYGDRDSLGAFQQRTGWGSAADRTNVARSADAFYRALKAVPRWQAMPVTVAAQAVQRSAFPGAYAQWEAPARATVAAAGGGSFTPAQCTTVAVPGIPANCVPTHLSQERGITPDALRLLRCGLAQYPAIESVGTLGNRPNKSDHPAGRAVDFMVTGWDTPAGKAVGDSLAQWARAHARQFGITYVIWYDRVWDSRRGGGWRSYTHPNGPTSDPNLRHLTHVHVSVQGNAGTGA